MRKLKALFSTRDELNSQTDSLNADYLQLIPNGWLLLAMFFSV